MVNYTKNNKNSLYSSPKDKRNSEKGHPAEKKYSPTLDKDIIHGLKEGSHKSFEIVFHTFYYRVRNFILSLTKDIDTAEELSQQVFVNIWDNRVKLDPCKNFNSFIYTVARNTALSYFRTQSLHKNIEHQVFIDEPLESIDSEIIMREVQYLIELTVGKMPRQRKKIYEMSQLDNKSNHEIAKELHISQKAVEKHLRLAFTEIRSVVQKFIYILIF